MLPGSGAQHPAGWAGCLGIGSSVSMVFTVTCGGGASEQRALGHREGLQHCGAEGRRSLGKGRGE